MFDNTSIRIDDRREPVPALIGVHNTIHLAGRLGLLAVPAEVAWERVIATLNEQSEYGYTFALDLTATVPYDTPKDTVDAYTEELIRDVPFTDTAPLGDETRTDQDSAVQQQANVA